MEMYAEALRKLRESIFSSDLIILIAGILAFFSLIIILAKVCITKKKIEKWKEKRNEEFSKYLAFSLSFWNTLFLTLVTFFPLLGMLGTVIGLLGLDMVNGDMENIKNNFFIALTSTAWGIIFSVFFKLLYAFFVDFIEETIESAKKLSEEKGQQKEGENKI